MAKLRIALFFILTCLTVRCDFNEEPLTDPAEMLQKAVNFYKEKSYKQAQPLFERAIPLFEQQQSSDKILEGYSYLAQTNLAQGDIRVSLGNFQAAIGWSKKAGDFRAETRLNILLGDVYSSIREYPEAIKKYRLAQLLVSAVNDERSKAEAEFKLATALFESGEDQESLEGLRRAITLYRQQGDRVKVSQALRNLGKLYRRLGQYAEAVNSIQQALGSITESQEPLLASVLKMDLGLIHRSQGDLNAALGDLRDAANILRARRVGREYEGLMMFHIGSIYFDSNRYPEAKQHFNSALKIAQIQGDRIAESYLYVFLIQCNLKLMTLEQRRQNTGRLQQSYEQIAKRFREAAHRTGEAYLWTQVARLYESQGNAMKAEEMYQSAMQLDETSLGEFIDKELHEPFLEALNIHRENVEWYYAYAHVLMKSQKEGEALSVVEKARNKALFDVLQGVDFAIRNPQIQKLISETRKDIQQLKILELELSSLLFHRQRSTDVAKVSRLRGEMVTLRQKVTGNANRVASLYPNYEPLIHPTTVRVGEISSMIPRGTLLVSYLPAEDQLYIFAVSRQQFEIRKVAIPRDSLVRLMNSYRRLIQDPHVYAGIGGTESLPLMTEFARLSTRLYDILIRPIDKFIDRNLVIVLNKYMEGFPFHALEKQDRSGNVKYLIEMTTVDFLPSYSSLRFRTTSSSRIRDIVAVGNPNGKNWSVDYELRDVRSFVKGTTILLGQEASWKNLQPEQGDVLQLSTEFAYGRGSSPLGEMMLSVGTMIEQTEDIPFERLTELNPFSVVLLSNQFGQGIGLSSVHAFVLRLNGTSDIFFNAWTADRKAAKFFSEYFYTHLGNGLAPGDAYRQALLNLIRTREVSHPRSWAQFFHFGVG
ncbi:MAG: CHAT domain-containing protein, partial [Bacteroidetes bacterium]|nr:CHAT domain-containing protein [Bacteroidota bacterium]